MMGLTASCKTKVNYSGEDTLLKLTTACATCAMWLCVSCRWPNNLVMASCPFLSNACMFPCRHILDITSGPVGILSLETCCCTLSAVSSGCSRKAAHSLSGIVSSTTSVSIFVKYALSNFEKSWDKVCRKFLYASCHA